MTSSSVGSQSRNKKNGKAGLNAPLVFVRLSKLKQLFHNNNKKILLMTHDFGAVPHNERRFQFRTFQSLIPNCNKLFRVSWVRLGSRIH